MTTRISDGPLDDSPLDEEHGPPMDINALHEDDLLLDRLGRGEEPDDGDAVASTLARWRGVLPGHEPADPVDDELLAAALATLQPRRRVSRVARQSAILSVAVVLGFGTVAAAEQAGPGSPLWPLTQLMFHDRAEARKAIDAAEDSVSAARVSIDGGHYDEASRLLDEATADVGRIGEGADADRLREEIADLRALIPSGTADATPDPAEPVPPSDAPPPDMSSPDKSSPDGSRSAVPQSPVESLVPTPGAPTVGSSVVPAVPPLGPGIVEIPPPLVSNSPLLPEDLPVVDGPPGLVR